MVCAVGAARSSRAKSARIGELPRSRRRSAPRGRVGTRAGPPARRGRRSRSRPGSAARPRRAGPRGSPPCRPGCRSCSRGPGRRRPPRVSLDLAVAARDLGVGDDEIALGARADDEGAEVERGLDGGSPAGARDADDEGGDAERPAVAGAGEGAAIVAPVGHDRAGYTRRRGERQGGETVLSPGRDGCRAGATARAGDVAGFRLGMCAAIVVSMLPAPPRRRP